MLARFLRKPLVHLKSFTMSQRFMNMDLVNKVRTPEVNTLLDAFKKNKFEIMIAGGPVRDILSGITPHDLDFATTATPDEMKKIAEAENFRLVNNNGELHGTITFHLNGLNFEVTTLRIDKVTDGRKAEVEFHKDWELDSLRRDLTVNSMFLDLDTGKVIDYHNGQVDLENKRINFVGNPEDRITEDFLRILRYFRFYGRIAKEPHIHCKKHTDAIKKYSHNLSMITGERIWTELSKILIGNHRVHLLQLMKDLGCLAPCGINPKSFDIEKFAKLWSGNLPSNIHPATVFASLCANMDDVDAANARLKFSKLDLSICSTIIDGEKYLPWDLPEFKKRFVIGPAINANCSHLRRSCLVQLAIVQSRLFPETQDLSKDLEIFEVPKFPMDGTKVVEATGLKGPKLGVLVGGLKYLWVKSNFTTTEQDLLASIDRDTGTVRGLEGLTSEEIQPRENLNKTEKRNRRKRRSESPCAE